MKQKTKEILAIVIIYGIIFGTFTWLIISIQNSGLKTGYKGGMHSKNDGCSHIIGGQ